MPLKLESSCSKVLQEFCFRHCTLQFSSLIFLHPPQHSLPGPDLLPFADRHLRSLGQIQINPGTEADQAVALPGIEPISRLGPADDPAAGRPTGPRSPGPGGHLRGLRQRVRNGGSRPRPDDPDLVPARIERIKKQMEVESQYVSRIICFEYLTYMSPACSQKTDKLYN